MSPDIEDKEAAHELDAADEPDDPEDEPDDYYDEPDDTGDAPDDPADSDPPEEPDPFIPLGSEDPPELPPADAKNARGAHAAIARSLHPPPSIPRVLHKEARAFFDGAMYAYTEGDLAGARLSFLAVAAIADPDTAPAAMVFLGVIAFRRRDTPEARMWFTRASTGPDEHWALVASQELRRLG